MRRLRKLLAMSASDRRLLVEAALFLGAIRIGLRLVSFPTLWRLIVRARERAVGSTSANRQSPDRITWAVNLTSPYMLGAKPCLPRALAAQLLLVRRGLPARLRVGVAKGDPGKVQAHAWTETDGTVVTGGSQRDLARYTPLLTLDAQRR